MSNDVNINVRTPGTQQSRAELDGVSQSVSGVGARVDEAGQKTQTFGERARAAMGRLSGAMGIAGIATAVAAAAAKVASFLNDIEKASDQAVEHLRQVRSEYERLFEPLGAFSEQAQRQVVLDITKLLQETGVGKQVGVPIIDVYSRQFKALVDSGQLTQGQYDEGLRGMLGYGARHGGAATADLIRIMAGWGIRAPQAQGEFRRMIAEASGASGIEDADLIETLGRGMPTIRAMGWTPTEAIGKVSALAAGEVGRQKTAVPMAVLQAIYAPSVTKPEAFGLTGEQVEDPKLLLDEMRRRRATMQEKEFLALLREIYGREQSAGVYKLLSTDLGPMDRLLQEAAGAAGAKREAEEEAQRGTNIQTLGAQVSAAADRLAESVTDDEKRMAMVRELGEAYRKKLVIREPIRQFARDVSQFEAREQEYGAFRQWWDALNEAERTQIQMAVPPLAGVAHALRRPVGIRPVSEGEKYWELLSPEQKLGALTGIGPRLPELTAWGADGGPGLQLGGDEPMGTRPATVIHNHYNWHNDLYLNQALGMNRQDLLIEPPDLD